MRKKRDEGLEKKLNLMDQILNKKVIKNQTNPLWEENRIGIFSLSEQFLYVHIYMFTNMNKYTKTEVFKVLKEYQHLIFQLLEKISEH